MEKAGMRSPIVWFGGKGQLVPKLLKYVPKHTYYCEVFGGGANLLFAKEPSSFEVYNDIDSGLVNFFKVLRDERKFEKFYRKVCLTPYSRETYDWCRENWENIEDEIERAWAFYILARWSFGGRFGSGWGYVVNEIGRNMSSVCSRWLSIIDLLPEIHQRVMRVQIEHLNWYDLLEKYDWEYSEGFCYLDPPYLPETRRGGGYRHELDADGHEKLVQYLIDNQEKKRFMLSGYDNDVYKRLEDNGWKKVCWDVACSSAGRTRGTGILGEGATRKHNQRRKDCIWFNYELQKIRRLF